MNINSRKHLQGKRIKIFTRSFSLEMYRYASGLFENQGVEHVRLTDQMADGYLYTILKDADCDIAINIDEDAFVTAMDAVWDLADYVVEHGYANAGCPDGGVDIPRGGNPIITNPFFNILNVELIRALPIDKKRINRFDYSAVKEEMVAAFPTEMLLAKRNFSCYDIEPYYPFFFWLAYHFKTLYLSCERHKDGVTTILYNHNRQPLCYHSWFARFYKVKPEQTVRINALIDEAYAIRKITKPDFSSKDKCRFMLDFCLRRCIRIPMRMGQWPNKWRKWYRRYLNRKLS